VADILAWEAEFGTISAENVVLLYTGSQTEWLDKNGFLNHDAGGNMHIPGFGNDATQFLTTERQIARVGIDTDGVDSGQDNNLTTNRLVLAKQPIVLENLTNLEQLPPQGTTIFFPSWSLVFSGCGVVLVLPLR
jgi:kynurenine formamidase